MNQDNCTTYRITSTTAGSHYADINAMVRTVEWEVTVHSEAQLERAIRDHIDFATSGHNNMPRRSDITVTVEVVS
jgi:hypothetical protein